MLYKNQFYECLQAEDDKEKKTEERKRKRSPSPREEAPRAPPIARPENEPTVDENSVLLSWCKYITDLHEKKNLDLLQKNAHYSQADV